MSRVVTLAGLFLVVAALFVLLELRRPEVTTSGTIGEANPDFDAIDRYVSGQMQASGIPGLALAIVHDGKTVWAQGFGKDGRGGDVTPRTPFWIGSNTKSVTALAVMQLAEAGRIALDAPVTRYLPAFRATDPEASGAITVRHLLNQTSGFSRQTGIEMVLAGKQQSVAETVADLRDVQLNREPGSTFEYSNANYVVLGAIVEAVSGQTWNAYVQERIFQPLDMRNSYTTLEDAQAHGLTDVHSFVFGFPIETEGTYLPGLAPTGYLYSTAEDMAHYLAMYLEGGTYNGRRLLSESGIRDMLAAATNESDRQLQGHSFTTQYGRGWFVGEFGAARDARWHLGNLPYLTAWMVLLPETDQAVVVMINAGSQFELLGANEVFSRIPIGVVNILRSERSPEGTSLARFFLLFDIAVLAALAVQVWSLLRVAREPAGFPAQGAVRGARYVAPLVWELGAAGYILLAFPASLGASWLQAVKWAPDQSSVLLAVAVLWLLTGGMRVFRIAQAFLTSSRVPGEVHAGATGGLGEARR